MAPRSEHPNIPSSLLLQRHQCLYITAPNAGSIELINNSDSAEKKEKKLGTGLMLVLILQQKNLHMAKLPPNPRSKQRYNNSSSLPVFPVGFFHLHLQISGFSTFSCFHRQLSPRSPIYQPQSSEAMKLYICLFGTGSSLPILHKFLVGGFNPSEKCASNWKYSPNRGEISRNIWNILKPPPRFVSP